MNIPVEFVPIDSITVRTRLRTDYGDIASLAESITDNGLLHPLVIDQDNVLICGGRRLRALRQLEFAEVPVRRWTVLDDTHRKAIELAENIHRKDLTEIEKSRDVVKAAELAREVDRETCPDSGQVSKGSRGPAQQPGSVRRVEELTGIPKATLRDAEKHVTAVDSYPFLAQPGWRQYHAMEAAEALDKLPEEERTGFAALIDQPGIPPRNALEILHNVASKPEPERKKIIELAQSDDDRDRTLALTTAAERPPMPDPRLTDCDEAIYALKRAIKSYPNDPEVGQIKSVIEQIKAIADAIEERTKHVVSAAD